MEFIQELKQNATDEIDKLNQFLAVIEEGTNKKELMNIRRKLITKKYLNKKHQGNPNNPHVKSFNDELKCKVQKLLEEFDAMYNITEDDYTSSDAKLIY